MGKILFGKSAKGGGKWGDFANFFNIITQFHAIFIVIKRKICYNYNSLVWHFVGFDKFAKKKDEYAGNCV